jgi:hypothetical protein
MTTIDAHAEPPDDEPLGPEARDGSDQADDPAALMAEMRAEVEAATRQLDELTAAVRQWHGRVDELESVLDVLLRVGDRPLAVVGDDLRLVGLSPPAARALGCTGIRLPAHLPAPLAELVDRWRRDGDAEAQVTAGEWSAQAVPVAGGGVVLVLAPPA